LILLGDGTKNLDGTGGDFQITVTVGGQTIQPDPQTVTFSTAVRGSVFTIAFPVPANSEVLLRVLSPNAGDTDVDVTAYLYEVSGLQPTVLGRTLDVTTTGESNPYILATGTVGATGNSPSALHMDGQPWANDEINDRLVVVYDVSEDEYHSQWILDFTATGTLALLWGNLPFTPQDNVDTYTILGNIRHGDPPELLVETTVASVTDQTNLVLTSGAPDNDAYNDQLVIITFAALPLEIFVTSIDDYVASTKTITLRNTPIFTVAPNDKIKILSSNLGQIGDTPKFVGDFPRSLGVDAVAGTTRSPIRVMDENSDPVDLEALPGGLSCTLTPADGTAATSTVGTIVKESSTGRYYIPITTTTTIEDLIGEVTATLTAAGTQTLPFTMRLQEPMRGTDSAFTGTEITIRDEMDSNSTQLSLIVTTGGPGPWTTGGGGSTGTGARTITVTVDDGTNPLENAAVRYTEGANTYIGSTDVSGNITFNLDDATYTVAIYKAGYTFVGTTLVVTGDSSPTYSMSQIVITPPGDPAQTTGYFILRDELGVAVGNGTVYFRMKFRPLGLGTMFDDDWFTATSAVGTGLVEVALYIGATYEIGINQITALPYKIPTTAGTTHEIPNMVT
jgi:hypothetical protein